MAEIISIENNQEVHSKQNPLKSVKDWFLSLDKVVRFSLLFVVVIAVVASIAGGIYLNTRSHAGGMGEIKEVWISRWCI